MKKIILGLFTCLDLASALTLHLRTAQGIYAVTTYPVKFYNNRKAYVCIEYNKRLKDFKPVTINSSYESYWVAPLKYKREKIYLYVYEGYKPYALCDTKISDGFKMELTYKGEENINGYKIVNLDVNRVGDAYQHYHKSNILLIYKNNREIAQINTLTPLQSLKIIGDKIYIRQLKTPKDQIDHYCFYLDKTDEMAYDGHHNGFSFTTLKSCMHNKAIEDAYWDGKIQQENPYPESPDPGPNLVPPFYLQNFYINK